MRQNELKIKQNIYYSLFNDTRPAPPETGGILGGKNGLVTCFFADEGEISNEFNRYCPDTNKLNKILSVWDKNNIDFMGIYHSHPCNQCQLSAADIHYINTIMKSLSNIKRELYFPLIIPQNKFVSFCAVNIAGEINIFQTAIKIL